MNRWRLALQEMINEVLNAEQKADELLSSAKKKASEIRAKAESEVNEKLLEVREQSRLKIQKEIEDYKVESKRNLDLEIEKAKEKSMEYFHSNKNKIDDLVNKVVELIISPEIQR